MLHGHGRLHVIVFQLLLRKKQIRPITEKAQAKEKSGQGSYKQINSVNGLTFKDSLYNLHVYTSLQFNMKLLGNSFSLAGFSCKMVVIKYAPCLHPSFPTLLSKVTCECEKKLAL